MKHRCISAVILSLPCLAWADDLPKSTSAFIDSHCIDCHDAGSARAGFRIDLLTADFTAGNNAGLWKEVMDKINAGEMPPKKKPQPNPQEAFAVASWVAQKLDETTKAAQGAGGRVPMRRLNRVEYANTVRDIFSLEEGFARRIENELPADGKVGGFDRGAASLFMDDGQLDKYMAVADLILDQAVFNEKPAVQKFTLDATKEKYIHGIGVCYSLAAKITTPSRSPNKPSRSAAVSSIPSRTRPPPSSDASAKKTVKGSISISLPSELSKIASRSRANGLVAPSPRPSAPTSARDPRATASAAMAAATPNTPGSCST